MNVFQDLLSPKGKSASVMVFEELKPCFVFVLNEIVLFLEEEKKSMFMKLYRKRLPEF
jgi:hypothetical protein